MFDINKDGLLVDEMGMPASHSNARQVIEAAEKNRSLSPFELIAAAQKVIHPSMRDQVDFSFYAAEAESPMPNPNPLSTATVFSAYNQAVEDAKESIRGESQGGGYWAATYINAIARKCSPHRYVAQLSDDHAKGRLVGVRLFDLLDLVVAVREHNRNFAQHSLADITRPVSDDEVKAFAESLLRSPEYSAEDVKATQEMILEWRSCEDTVSSILNSEEAGTDG